MRCSFSPFSRSSARPANTASLSARPVARRGGDAVKVQLTWEPIFTWGQGGGKGRNPKMLFHHLDPQGRRSLAGGPASGERRVAARRPQPRDRYRLRQSRNPSPQAGAFHFSTPPPASGDAFPSARSPCRLTVPGEWGYPSKRISIAVTVPGQPLSSSPGAMKRGIYNQLLSLFPSVHLLMLPLFPVQGLAELLH